MFHVLLRKRVPRGTRTLLSRMFFLAAHWRPFHNASNICDKEECIYNSSAILANIPDVSYCEDIIILIHNLEDLRNL